MLFGKLARYLEYQEKEGESFINEKKILYQLYLLLSLIHFCLIFLFLFLKITTMYYFNIGSVISYAAIIALHRKGLVKISFYLCLVEIVMHVAFATVCTGLTPNFYLFIITWMPVIVYFPWTGKSEKLFQISCCVVIVLATFAMLYRNNLLPLYFVQTEMQVAIAVFNIIMVVSLYSYMSFLFADKLTTTNENLFSVNSELQKTIKALNKTRDQLVRSESMMSLGRLVAGVAHEINTPVGISLTSISFIDTKTKEIARRYNDKDFDKADMENYFNIMNDSISLSLNNLTKAAKLIVSFKSLSVDMSNEEKRLCNLAHTINNTLTALNPKLSNNRHKINVLCDENITFNGYPGALSQILTNLILNSLIHGFDDDYEGQITIEGFLSCSKAIIVYTDDGKGIRKDIINKIFEPFFTTNRFQGNTGLGLNVVFNIVDHLLHGTIRCESKENKWTKFTIEFPIEQTAKIQEDALTK